ncbi:MAG: hypothetical protein Q9157_008894 [Trypethelium eluteriae]
MPAGREQAAEVTEALIAHPAVRKVDFIGSAAVGRVIGATAARYLKPVLMELGGKCPAIVLEDADLGKAATLCAKGATLHHGQICFSTERIIVLRKAAEEFQNLLVKAFEANPSAGAAVTEAGVKHAEDVLRDAQEKGEKFLLGGGIERGKTATLKPAIILEPKSSRIVDEETFGPSASLYVVESDEEAIELANMSAYGLNATIHTKDLARGIKMAHELEYGQVHINSISVFTASTGSQGGVKGSGWGRQNAGWGLHEFLIEKFVSYHGDPHFWTRTTKTPILLWGINSIFILYIAATTPAIANATIPPNACCVGAAAAELATLAALAVAPALPEGEEPLPVEEALVVIEPADEALEDESMSDDADPIDDTDEGKEEEGIGEDGEDGEDGGETDDESEIALLREDAAEEGTPGAVETTDLELVGALVVLAVDEAPAGPL